jgi:hypothetical protein
MALLPRALRYTLSDAMLDYADQADSTGDSTVADMYRKDARSLTQPMSGNGDVEVEDFVHHSAHSAIVEKLAIAQDAAQTARVALAQAEADYVKYAKILDQIR